MLAAVGYSRDLMLPWENEADFEVLYEVIREELDPEGSSEEEVVLDIACLRWKKRRVMIGSNLAYARHPDTAALIQPAEKGWNGVGEFLRGTIDDGDRVCDSVRATAKHHGATVQGLFAKIDEKIARMDSDLSSGTSSGKDARPSNREELILLIKLVEKLNAVGSNLISRNLEFVEKYDLDQKVCERAYRPEIMEAEMKLEALIDKQIEKALSHLVHLKEYKRMHVPKEVKGTRIDVIEPALGHKAQKR